MKPKQRKSKAKPVVEASSVSAHKKSLANLQHKDPEFYKFLKQQKSDLLEFDDSDPEVLEDEEDMGPSDGSEENEESGVSDEGDEDDEEEDAEVEDEEEEGEEAEEEEGSDVDEMAEEIEMDDEEDDDYDDVDSDEEGSKKKKKKKKSVTTSNQNLTKVTVEMVNQWVDDIRSEDSVAALRNLVSSFTAAVHQVKGDQSNSSSFKVQGTLVFNAVVRGCLSCVFPALQRILKLTSKGKSKSKDPPLPSKGHGWRKIMPIVKEYLANMIRFIRELVEPNVLEVTLKHSLLMVPYFVTFPKFAKALLKTLIRVWSSSESKNRLVAFLTITKLIRLSNDALLEPCFKLMYVSFIKNCKFTSPRTLPMIRFMEQCLVELLAMDVKLAYQYAFVYIRQLAIHLRTAITIKKEEKMKAVYNWQYMHSLHLWAQLLSSTHPNSVLEPLIYPLTQVITGTIKLSPTAQYLPLRFHCARMLNTLSASTHTYIPVLPFLLEVLNVVDFNKKPKNAQLKPFLFPCLLRFSKSQMLDRAFKDGVMDHVVELAWDNMNIHAHTLAFPEIVLPAQVQLKKFLKTCKVANYCKQIKSLLTKVEENSKTITQRRKTANLSLADTSAVNSWEAKSKEHGTPLSKHYVQWRQMRDKEMQQLMKMATEAPSENEEDEDGPRGRKRKHEKKKGKKGDEEDDDFTAEELEQLNRSASEDEEDDENEGSTEDEAEDDSDEEDGDFDEEEDEEPSPKKKKLANGGGKSSRSQEIDVENISAEEDIVKDFSFSSDEGDSEDD